MYNVTRLSQKINLFGLSHRGTCSDSERRKADRDAPRNIWIMGEQPGLNIVGSKLRNA